jgi:aminoglycoside/choline kinase family phosphotransferase
MRMSNRAVEIAGFLSQHGWDEASPTPLAADFSPRQFARLENREGRRAILMDATGDQKTPDFIAIAKLLRGCDLSAPEIYAADPLRGLVLMEDFGDANIGRMLDSGTPSVALYRRAVDVLAHLHKTFDRSMAKDMDLPVFGGALFSTQVEVFLDAWFLYAKERAATAEESESFRAAWKQALKGIEALPQTLLLRDYMPDNLMDLSERTEWRSVGLLDFQDAGHGPVAYDIASLCEAARRNIEPGMLDDMIAYYHEKARPSISADELKAACHILSAQRHMRILGPQWTKMTEARRKQEWFLRITKYLDHLLQDPALKSVRLWIEQHRVFERKAA